MRRLNAIAAIAALGFGASSAAAVPITEFRAGPVSSVNRGGNLDTFDISAGVLSPLTASGCGASYSYKVTYGEPGSFREIVRRGGNLNVCDEASETRAVTYWGATLNPKRWKSGFYTVWFRAAQRLANGKLSMHSVERSFCAKLGNGPKYTDGTPGPTVRVFKYWRQLPVVVGRNNWWKNKAGC